MKIKVALLSWFLANSVSYASDVYSDQDQDTFELDTYELDEIIVPVEKEKDGAQFIRLNGEIAMGPISLEMKEEEMDLRNDVKGRLDIKGDVPEVYGDQSAAIKLAIRLARKEVAFKEASVVIGPLTIGYGESIFGYAKANPFLPISTDASVVQLRCEHVGNCLRFGYAVESPVEVKVGLFDKNYIKPAPAEEEVSKNGDQKKSVCNRLDDVKDKKRAFKIKNRIPAVGTSIGLFTDRFSMDMSGLMRTVDYTHADSEAKLIRHWMLTGGANLGVQYKFIPDQFSLTVQAIYVYGLGDYVIGLSDIQAKEDRKEMCALYYTDQENAELARINAYGIGGTLSVSPTSKWTYSLAGSYLSMLEDQTKPMSAFKTNWLVTPKILYNLSKRWSLSLSYTFTEEYKVGHVGHKSQKDTDKDRKQIVSGAMKISF